MNDKKDEELTNLQKFLALCVIVIIVIIICVIYAVITGNRSDDSFHCDTNYNPTPCPEPDYDQEVEDTVRQYPDDSY